MTAVELISDLRLMGRQDFSVYVEYIAAKFDQVQLANGRFLRDGLDFKQFLEELAEAGRAIPARKDAA